MTEIPTLQWPANGKPDSLNNCRIDVYNFLDLNTIQQKPSVKEKIIHHLTVAVMVLTWFSCVLFCTTTALWFVILLPFSEVHFWLHLAWCVMVLLWLWIDFELRVFRVFLYLFYCFPLCPVLLTSHFTLKICLFVFFSCVWLLLVPSSLMSDQ